jgi:pyruvate dehydrogenase E1 component alpha subunit
MSRLTNDELLRCLRAMIRIRRVEDTLADIYPKGEMRTPTHFSIGQEAVAVGVCAVLRREDAVYSGHRCHAHYLAKGGSLLGMVAELFGREAGCARGRGGSVHLNDPSVGMLGATAIMGQTIAVAAGTALAYQMDRLPRVAVSFFGDGCIEEGVFHESVNFAVVRRLPVVFVCENNLYSVHSPLGVRQPAGVEIDARARSYGMPAVKVDGNDVEAVYAAARDAVARARGGEGPSLIEALTYRWREHVGPLFDYDRGYRTKDEVDAWIARCPIKRAAAVAVERGACLPADVERWHQEFQEEVDGVIAVTRESPFPSPADITQGTY